MNPGSVQRPTRGRGRTGRLSRAPVNGDLCADLSRLQSYGLGLGLRAVWIPDASAKVDAEVLGDAIRIYVTDHEEARKALLHEVIHREVVEARKPLLRALNALLQDINSQVYQAEERLVERLLELIGDQGTTSRGL